jgi:hypothetical protein
MQTAGFATDPTKLPLGGIMSGLIQSTSTEFLEVSTSAYTFIMQQIQLELDIYNLMLSCSRISVEIVQPLALQ